MLAGEAGENALERLGRTLREERPEDEDAALTGLLQQIDLRAAVRHHQPEPRGDVLRDGLAQPLQLQYAARRIGGAEPLGGGAQLGQPWRMAQQHGEHGGVLCRCGRLGGRLR